MKARFVLDAWAILALLQKEEPAASRVKELLEGAEEGKADLFISIISSVKFSIVSARSREKGRPRIPWMKFVVCP